MNKKSILFVDDDQNVISGIQRQLRPYREQWSLFSANSGSEALQMMAQQPVDLIVSDMMMPEMRGDELLRIVRERHPSVVRMILSGYADDGMLKSGMEVAHQYLSKPCNPDMLREVICQIFKIQACVSNPQVVAGVGDPNQLPSLPKIYQTLNVAIADESTNARDIADILAHDMVLSVKLLQLVNSPYFGLNRVVSSLTEAINLLGLKKLRNLVLSGHVKTTFAVHHPEMRHYMEYLWLDAERVSDLARLIALSENQPGDRPDQAYLGGLLHNMGLLMFLSRGGEKLENLIEAVKNTDTPVAELETAIYGFTRSDAAAYVLSLWKIPPPITEAILLQNKPQEGDYDSVNALTAVHVASCLLKPSAASGCDRLFGMNLDYSYLQRLDKLDRLPDWQMLAEQVLANDAARLGVDGD